MKKITRLLVVVAVLFVGTFFLLKKDSIPFEELKKKYASEQSKFIDVNGINVHYRIEGEGAPILLIHGTGAALQTWNVWTDSLKKTHQVIRLDIPAFGLTGARKDNDYSVKTYVQFLNDFVKKIGVDSFDIAGNSLGGEIAAAYALAFPQKVKHLILIDPAGFYDDSKMSNFSIFKLARSKFVGSLAGIFDTKIIVNQTLKEVYFDDSKFKPEPFNTYYDLSLRDGNREAFVARVQQLPLEPKLDVAKITNKTLLIWGKEDELLDVSLAKNFEVIPNVQEIIYDDCGHSPQEEIPAKSVADVMRFIGE